MMPRFDMFRGPNQLLFIIGVSLWVAGCNVHPEITTQPSKPAATRSDFASSQKSPQVDPLSVAIELDPDPVGGWVQQSGNNPAIYELVSKYRGKLYLVTVDVAEADYHIGFRSPSIISAPDLVYFRIAVGNSIPGHPTCHVLKFACDLLNSEFRFKQGNAFRIAFTEAGQYVALWPADLTVVPGMSNPRDDDPNSDQPKQAPAFQLIEQSQRENH
jgi:hypothetical protein